MANSSILKAKCNSTELSVKLLISASQPHWFTISTHPSCCNFKIFEFGHIFALVPQFPLFSPVCHISKNSISKTSKGISQKFQLIIFHDQQTRYAFTLIFLRSKVVYLNQVLSFHCCSYLPLSIFPFPHLPNEYSSKPSHLPCYLKQS